MPRHRMQPRALRELVFDVGKHRREHAFHGGVRRGLAEYFGIDTEQSPRLLVGRPPQHHAIDMVEVAPGLRKAADTAIDDDGNA